MKSLIISSQNVIVYCILLCAISLSHTTEMLLKPLQNLLQNRKLTAILVLWSNLFLSSSILVLLYPSEGVLAPMVI